ncbi:hypothetical protein AYI69_g1422 [Smittium culicis]|uniref:ATP synthase subunit K, mitochondrial n=1 Tax=Smittium culicis TaxID=133412 RepID=A0A1R1XQB1_9FUNG|nr:hypothetical protein AYI69_g7684 [Smittium culicis]OMJ29087.1 hypothetical protein AYI69_g1422 [Smittium culicis]
MAGFYTIAGKNIPTHYLALGLLTTYGVAIKFALSGKSEPKVVPAVTANSEDEYKFIMDFIKEAEASEKKH